jgi:tetratricopeptide (TPR) repeat protein
MLLGAGCSRSAGIRLAGEIAQKLAIDLAGRLGASAAECGCADDALTWLVRQGALREEEGTCDWGRRYGEIFGTLLTSDSSQREIIQAEIAEGRGQINWAHVCVGELVNKHYVHTVLTTNFDQLVVKGIILTGRLPVIADGLEALNRVVSSPADPQVVHMHGSMHTYSPRNSPVAVQETSSELPMQGTMWGILRDSDLLVVVGYAGKEEGVVELLIRAGRDLPNLVVYWVTYEPDESALSEEVRRFLLGPNKHLIHGQDADAFFAAIMREVNEAIDWIGDPLSPLEARKTEIVRPQAVEEVNVLLDEYAVRLDQMRATAAASISEFKLGRAAMDSLSGMDEKVVVALSQPDSAVDSRAERLLAASLFKTGDAAQDASRLQESVRIWRGYIAKGDIRDGIAFLRLGDALQALADLQEEAAQEAPGAMIEAADGGLREESVAAYEQAVTTIDSGVNESAWREAREKYATAVIEFGTKGAALEKLDLAIAGLRELLESGRVGPAPLARAETYDRLSALYLMRADRTAAAGDFQNAVEASAQALDTISNERGSTTVAVMQRNLAAAVRGLAEHRQKEGLAEEAIDELRRAAALYRGAGEAYLDGVRDADLADARLAAAETLDEARDIYRAIGAEDEAVEVEAILATLLP